MKIFRKANLAKMSILAMLTMVIAVLCSSYGGERVYGAENDDLTVKLEIEGTYKGELKNINGDILEDVYSVVGDTITLNAYSSGGIGDHTYKYLVRDAMGGEFYTIKDYTSETSVSYKIDMDGYIVYKVLVKDSIGNVVESEYVCINTLPYLFTINGKMDNTSTSVEETCRLEVKGLEDEECLYRFVYYGKTGAAGENIIQDISEKNFCEFNFDEVGTYNVMVFLKRPTELYWEQANRVDVKVFEKPLSANLEISGTSEGNNAYCYDEILYEIMAEGGSGKYTYECFMYTTLGNETRIYRSGSDGLFEHQLIESGEYTFYAVVTDSEGNTAETEHIKVNVSEINKITAYLITHGVSRTKNEYMSYMSGNIGDTLELSIRAIGGTGGYTYKFVFRDIVTGDEIVLQDYSTKSTYSKEIVAGMSGEYLGYVKDSNGRVCELDSVMIYAVEENISATFSMNGITEGLECKVGEEITIVANASGGAEGYSYQFYVWRQNDEWSYSLDAYYESFSRQSTETFTWVPKTSGIYEAKVVVYDKFKNYVVSYSDIDNIDFNGFITVTDKNEELAVKVDSTLDVVTEGDSITLTAKAEGGSGDYTYSYIVYNKNTKKWARLADNITSNKYTWKAKGEGDRTFYVDVKDKDGKVVRSKAINVKVAKALKVTASATSKELTVGNKLVLTAKAEGGQGEYTYSYIVYNKSTKKWARLADNVAMETYSWKASSAGERIFYVDVKDGTGKVVRSEVICVNVIEQLDKLSITVKASMTETNVGGKITFTATAAGGSGDYTYSYIVYNKSTKKWARLADNVISNTYTWKAGSVGERVFYVDVKDSTGMIVRSMKIDVSVK